MHRFQRQKTYRLGIPLNTVLQFSACPCCSDSKVCQLTPISALGVRRPIVVIMAPRNLNAMSLGMPPSLPVLLPIDASCIAVYPPSPQQSDHAGAWYLPNRVAINIYGVLSSRLYLCPKQVYGRAATLIQARQLWGSVLLHHLLSYTYSGISAKAPSLTKPCMRCFCFGKRVASIAHPLPRTRVHPRQISFVRSSLRICPGLCPGSARSLLVDQCGAL